MISSFNHGNLAIPLDQHLEHMEERSGWQLFMLAHQGTADGCFMYVIYQVIRYEK
jgi:hypothetical protein